MIASFFCRVVATAALCLWLPAVALAKVPAQADVVIVGAGLSGLVTAHELKKAGLSFHILELTPRVGGRVRTVRYKVNGGPELYADSGMEEYWESNPAVKLLKELKLPVRSDYAASSTVILKKLEKLGPNDNGTNDYLSRIFTEKEFKALQSFKDRVAPMVAQLHGGKGIDPALMKLKNVSFAEWVRKQSLSERVADWVRVAVECEVGTHWDRFSALDGIAEFHIFLGNGELSYRVMGGNEKFTDAIAKKVGLSNVSLNKRVTKVDSTGGPGVRVSYLDAATNQAGTIRAKHVVSTIPLYRLFEVQFDPPLSDKKRQAISTQTWGSYFKAHVFVPSSAQRHWTVGAFSILPILSDSELGVIYDGNPDQHTKTKIISLLVTGDHAEAFNMMPLDQVRSTIKAGFEKLWPGFSKEILGMEFYRFHPRAIAGWPVGRSRFDELSEELRRPENGVYLSGDFTEGTHSSGAFVSAYRVVRQILSVERPRGGR